MGSTQDEKLERLQKGEARIVLRGQEDQARTQCHNLVGVTYMYM